MKDAKAKDIYKFRYELDAEEDGGDLLSANVRYVQVTMEGDPNDLFDDPGGVSAGTIQRAEKKIEKFPSCTTTSL
jgi:hypothetical protein